ncbi:hypothetical protein CYMTET_4925 [Cymbomonas tetramitiformis]|uniref:Probable magnesium transporter n=1 Tax=Cymbomonas tetramitiformis TaxID=36881 RepID=A0AAE0H0F7_9CHLO|nr:hypothetical protein CYMTET_4925 [Cymbomonas tetramitiformis]
MVWWKNGIWWLGTLIYIVLGPACDLISTTCAGVETAVMMRMSFLLWTPLIAKSFLQEKFIKEIDGYSSALALLGILMFLPTASKLRTDFSPDEVKSLISSYEAIAFYAILPLIGFSLLVWYLLAESSDFQRFGKRAAIRGLPICSGILNGVSLCFSQAYTALLFKSEDVENWLSWTVFACANSLMLFVNIGNVKSLRHNTLLQHVPVFIETELIIVWTGGGVVYRSYADFTWTEWIFVPLSMICIGGGAYLSTRSRTSLPKEEEQRGLLMEELDMDMEMDDVAEWDGDAENEDIPDFSIPLAALPLTQEEEELAENNLLP